MEKNNKTAQLKKDEEFAKKVRDEIEKKTGKTPEQLLKEREKRVNDAIQLKVPDRVPVQLKADYFPIKYAGLSPSDIYYNSNAYKEAIVKTLVDFEPDMFTLSPAINLCGNAMTRLGTRQYKWPGGELRPDQHSQFLEMEIMKENEYELFITDPGDFILRYYLPRRFEALEPFAKLPPVHSLVGAYPYWTSRFGNKEIIKAFETLLSVGTEQLNFGPPEAGMNDLVTKLVGMPAVTYPGGVASPPFDYFVTHLRGMKGTMIDMFKRPEKLLEGMEKVLAFRIARAAPAGPNELGKRVQGGGNHFQSEEFLSKKQFETFAWPTWKKGIIKTIELGYTPKWLMEGKNDDRLECFLELPKGKTLIHFEKIDIERAKNILGGHMCIMGGVPGSLLWGGSPQDVEEYCKNLIKKCGKGGGYILSCGGVDDEAKPENIKAMIDSVKKYGWY